MGGNRDSFRARLGSIPCTVVAMSRFLGLAVVVWAFGWSGGRQLIQESYVDAKAKAAEQKAQRAARKEAKRAEESGAER